MHDKSPTYSDIASYTGFTKTTISRYFNKPDTVRPENRARIEQALEALNYKGNKVAQILAKGRTGYIGLLIPNLYLSFYSEVLQRFLSSYDRYGYKFILFSGNKSADVERHYIDELIEYKVEGLIALSHTLSSEELASYGLPIVAIEREDQYISSVNTDNYAGAVLATELLAAKSCDVMIHINRADMEAGLPSADRIRGFEDVCGSKGLRHEVYTYVSERNYLDLEEQIVSITRSIDSKYKGMTKGVFASSDGVANIVLNELVREGRRVPEEYRLVGFDGSPISEQAIIPFSSVAQQTALLVSNAMEILINQIEYLEKTEQTKSGIPAYEPIHRVIPPLLIERTTT